MWCVRSGYADGREHAPATSFKVCASIKLTPVCAVHDDNRRKTRSWHGQHTASGTRAVVRSLVEHNSIHETMFGRFCLAYAISNQTINNVKVSYEIGMCYFILVLCAHKHECVRMIYAFPLANKMSMSLDARRLSSICRCAAMEYNHEMYDQNKTLNCVHHSGVVIALPTRVYSFKLYIIACQQTSIERANQLNVYTCQMNACMNRTCTHIKSSIRISLVRSSSN